MKNTFGSNITLTIYGESHGPAVGAVLDGLPAGLPVDEAFIAACMEKRRARGDGLSTARTEADEVHILSGVYAGHTTGTPLALEILNQNTRSGDYAKTADLLRPGHADFTAYAKYDGYQDARGGGHFSGRITAGLVAAGAVCLGALQAKGIQAATHLARCAGVADMPFAAAHNFGTARSYEAELSRQIAAVNAQPGFAVLDPEADPAMKQAILAAGETGNSVGGILETAVLGLPAGAGEPFFDSVESVLAHLCFSIPAVKGIEFGAGFGFAELSGSTANDAFRMEGGRVVTQTNRNAGINGGITNGMPVVFRTVVKPTPSIYQTQQTVDFAKRENAELQIKGRHDPCIVPRAAIVQTCAAAFGLCDLLAAQFGPKWLLPGAPETEER
jgi:chorismate synthase